MAQDTTHAPESLANADAALTRLRAATPLVHCITNFVAMSTAANVVLAAGASPAMVHAEEEVADFVPIAGALTVNIGTISSNWFLAMRKAAEAARTSGTPWVLDPVAHFITPFRRSATAELVSLAPTIIRGNASEIIALAGVEAGGKGADSGDSTEAAVEPARQLAQSSNAVVLVTGERDYATDGERGAWIEGGHALMPQVTALGCAMTALTGAYAAVETDPLHAAIAASAHFGAAGAKAGETAAGPGSFAVGFLDALASTQPGDLNSLITAA